MNDDDEIRGRAFALQRKYRLTPDLARRAATDEISRDRLKTIWNNPGTPEHGYLTTRHTRAPTMAERKQMSVGRETDMPEIRDPAATYGDVLNASRKMKTPWGTELPAWQAGDESRRQGQFNHVMSLMPQAWASLHPKDADDLARSFANQATLGGADWLAGILGPRDIHGEQQASREAAARSPVATGAGALAGTMVPYSWPGKMLAAGKLPQALMAGAAMGSLHGGLSAGTSPKEIGRGAAYALPDSLLNMAPLLPGLIPLASAGSGMLFGEDPYHDSVEWMRRKAGISDWGPPSAEPSR